MATDAILRVIKGDSLKGDKSTNGIEAKAAAKLVAVDEPSRWHGGVDWRLHMNLT